MIQYQAEEKVYNMILRRLQLIGLDFVRNARISGNYTDRTGNLRSSVGFLLLKDGKVITQNWELSKKGTDRETGLRTGKSLAAEVAKEYPTGWVLIVVAGMDYAAAVEARESYDVITNSATIAESALKQFRDDIKRMAA